jgi:hypothetical protein
MMTLWIVLAGTISGMGICLCSLLAIWLAFGRTPIFLRMPLFLLGTLPLGLVVCLAAVDEAVCIYYVFGALLIAASLPRTHLALQVPAFAVGAAILVPLPFYLDRYSLDSSLSLRLTLAAILIAMIVSTMKWMGFRIVDLMPGITQLELERGTGRDLDQWFTHLDAAGASALNHAEIMALLRQDGFSLEWQKTVAVAYQTTLGRQSIGHTHDGRCEFVIADGTQGIVDSLARSTHQQFTIWQIMIATFCVACLLGFVRNFTWPVLTAIDMKYGVPLTLGVAAIAFAALWSSLAIGNARQKTYAACLFAVVAAVGVPYLMGLRSFNPFALVSMASLLVYSGLLFGLLHAVRNHGYRLVCVQPQTGASNLHIPKTRIEID